ncbi:uncharacterized protein LOC100176423 [Ciona intestinalis]
MALWWPCRSAVFQVFALLCLCSVQQALGDVCEPSNGTLLFDQYTTPLIPPERRFMLFASDLSEVNSKSVETLDFDHAKCIEAENETVVIRPCNSSIVSQKWYQLHNQLVSIPIGKCITSESNNFDTHLRLEHCKTNQPSQKWSCLHPNSTEVLLSGTGRFLAVSSGTVRNVDTKPANWRWKIADNSGEILEKNPAAKRLCLISTSSCPFPKQGVRSYFVTSDTALAKVMHLPKDLVLKHLGDTIKMCYTIGNNILAACPLGFVALGSQTKQHQEKTCIAGGAWSEQQPLHCVRRNCGRPDEGHHSTFIAESGHLYGDVVHYTCDAEYIPDRSSRICGPDGRWSGFALYCKHSCQFYLTDNSGTVRSLNYPQPYPSSKNCEWKIKVQQGLRVVFWFRDFFIEPGSPFTGDCRHDVFYINDSIGDRIEQFCGSLYPESWIAASNEVKLVFCTDVSGNSKGFKIDYTSWNSSMSANPVAPVRNGTFPDEEDNSHVYIGTEYANYFIEIVDGVLVISAIVLIAMLIVSHFFNDIRTRIHPVSPTSSEEDFYDETERNRRLAQRRMTTMFDPVTIAPKITVDGVFVTQQWMGDIGSMSSDSQGSVILSEPCPDSQHLPNSVPETQSNPLPVKIQISDADNEDLSELKENRQISMPPKKEKKAVVAGGVRFSIDAN